VAALTSFSVPRSSPAYYGSPRQLRFWYFGFLYACMQCRGRYCRRKLSVCPSVCLQHRCIVRVHHEWPRRLSDLGRVAPTSFMISVQLNTIWSAVRWQFRIERISTLEPLWCSAIYGWTRFRFRFDRVQSWTTLVQRALKKVIKTSDCRFAVDMDIHRYISMGRPIMLARLLINYGWSWRSGEQTRNSRKFIRQVHRVRENKLISLDFFAIRSLDIG